MGCKASTQAVGGGDGKVDLVLTVPDMPPTGGYVNAAAPDGQCLRFFVPAGYPPNSKVSLRYRPLPKPKPAPKAKASKAAAKAATKAAAKSAAAPKSAPGGTAAPTGTGSVAAEVTGVAAPAASTPVTPAAPVASATPAATAASSASAPAVSEAGGTAASVAPSAQVHEIQNVEANVIITIDKGLPMVPAQLPMFDGAWVWIRQANDDVHRATRIDAGRILRETFVRGGFRWSQGNGPTHEVRYKCIPKMVKNTRLLSVKQGLPRLIKDPGRTMELEYGPGISAIEKAETMALGSFNPTVVNAASAYHAGGGFTSGGRHALEEAFCSQTTLYASLERAMELWKKGEQEGIYRRQRDDYEQHIPTDGCILSPHVEIFRGGTDQGYLAHTIACPVAAVVSVAMYNKNHSVRDAPVDAPSNEAEYEAGVADKFRAAVHAAALSGGDALILPDVGCGVFKNDPTICGRIAGSILFEYRTWFKRCVFTGKIEFYQAAAEAMKSCSLSTEVTKRPSVDSRQINLPQVQNCVVCGKGLAGFGFSQLALLIDKKHKTHQMQLLHEGCVTVALKKFPRHQTMTLPTMTGNAESFLKALDLNGNGLVEKQELRCICAILWEGDLAKDPGAFEKDFESKWEMWDATHSGNVSLTEIKGQGQRAKASTMHIEGMPQSLIEWFQEQSRICATKKKLPA